MNNPNDLISREAAKAVIRSKFQSISDRCEINEVLNELPVVDAMPMAHGRWIDENPDDSLDPRMRCSICTGVESPLIKWRYCPNCGAKMDSE